VAGIRHGSSGVGERKWTKAGIPLVLKENLLVFFATPRPFHKGGWRGRFTRLEYLILNHRR
jgi:hypothetical protein